jgi:hypothetical protein
MYPAKPAGPQLTARTAREAFDLLVAAMPGFDWKEMRGVVVVRPTTAWTDSGDILNLRTAAFQLTDAPFNYVLHTVLHGVTPALLYPWHQPAPRAAMTTTLSMTYNGGPLLDALNAMVRAKHPAFWLVGYRGEPKRGTVSIRTFRPGAGVAYPITLPQRSSR